MDGNDGTNYALLSEHDLRRRYNRACLRLEPEALQSIHEHKLPENVNRWTAERDACTAELKRRGRA